MQYVLLFLAVCTITAQHVLKKQYNRVVEQPNPCLFSAVGSCAAIGFFLVSAGVTPAFHSEQLPLAITYGFCYAVTMLGSIQALVHGSMSLTMLIMSYSMIIPSFYGVLFLQERLSEIGVMGMILLVLSLLLINFVREEAKISITWLFWLTLAFVGNGMVGVLQKMQLLIFGDGTKSEFMIMALVFAIFFLLIAAIGRKESFHRENWKSILIALGNGTVNGLSNFMVMALMGMLPQIILNPSMSAGGIVLGFIMATFVYKERLSRPQLIGYVLGTVSIVLLNL